MNINTPIPCILAEGIYQLCLMPCDKATAIVSSIFPGEILIWHFSLRVIEKLLDDNPGIEKPFIYELRRIQRSTSAHDEIAQETMNVVFQEILIRNWHRLHYCAFFYEEAKNDKQLSTQLFAAYDSDEEPPELMRLAKVLNLNVKEKMKQFLTHDSSLTLTERSQRLQHSWQTQLDIWKRFAADTELQYLPHLIPGIQLHNVE